MKTGLALLGCGTVGSAVAEMLLTEKKLLQDRSGQSLELKHILVRNRGRKRKVKAPARLWTTNPSDIWTDPTVDVVVELIGGLEPARTLALAALRAGKHLVTANKHLLAVHGAEIFAAAIKARRAVCFEASCGGAIPIIMALTRGLVANDIQRVIGIVNGTCNYILTEMSTSHRTYADALAGAQAAGYAEADPTLDVNGTDSAHKLAILAALAFGAKIPFSKIEVSGIHGMQDQDLKYGQELGYVCKLLAIAEKTDHGISLRVHPTFLDQKQLLANVNGAFNAISVSGHAAGQTIYYGRGAGPRPTASAVIADIVEASMGTAAVVFAGLPLLTRRKPMPIVPTRDILSRNYLRMTALDVPGVMHHITGILGRQGISIAAVVQHESRVGQYVPLVVITHEARDGAVTGAVKQIDQLRCIRGHTVRIRIMEP